MIDDAQPDDGHRADAGANGMQPRDMRTEPTWRIPIGILLLLGALALYGIAVARYVAPLMAGWPTLLQMPAYLVLGVIWVAPLRRYLIWMETGRFG